jgi:hypothetical protein
MRFSGLLPKPPSVKAAPCIAVSAPRVIAALRAANAFGHMAGAGAMGSSGVGMLIP